MILAHTLLLTILVIGGSTLALGVWAAGMLRELRVMRHELARQNPHPCGKALR